MFFCTHVLNCGFELVHQLNIPLQPQVKYSGLGLNVVVSRVAVPRAPAGEEAADLIGFPPLPSKDYYNVQATIPLKQQKRCCPLKPL